jgi:hypothetical protein
MHIDPTWQADDRDERSETYRAVAGGVTPWRSAGWVLPLLAACAVVLTGHMLGGAWFSAPAAGLPAGLWVVFATGLVAYGVSRLGGNEGYGVNGSVRSAVPVRFERDRTRAEEGTARSERETPREVAAEKPGSSVKKESKPTRVTPRRARSLELTRPGDFVRRGGLAALSAAARSFEGSDGSVGSISASIIQRIDDRSRERGGAFGGVGRLRVGLMLDPWAVSRLATDEFRDVEWVRAEGSSPTRALAAMNLDAVVCEGEADGVVVRTREHASREAGWFDWGTPRPMTYFSIFPLRFDASRVTLHGLLRELEQGETAGVVAARRVVRLAALMSRLPGRLTLADRFAGRGALVRGAGAEVMADGLREAAEMLGEDPSVAERAAARVASAWIATEHEGLRDNERCRLADLVVRSAGDEPEVMLRSAAVRLSLMDENLGIEAIARADRMIRQRGVQGGLLGGLEHLRLVQAELEHGTFGEMTLGRVAAGLCLACAATPADRIAFLKDDLFEDFRFSHYLIGRDKEHAILMEVFRELERARRAETFGLPSAKAA